VLRHVHENLSYRKTGHLVDDITGVLHGHMNGYNIRICNGCMCLACDFENPL